MGSSLSSMLPASFGGYGRQTGPYGGLEGVEFAARCPPDIQKNTRIVAVCGIPVSDAAPQDDGWFFSDFFLFYQMLAKFRAELPDQLWLSCCSPSDLISKHQRYLHGPANGIAGDRRVVMNEEMLPKDETKAGFRVFEEKELLEKFLATLKSEIKEAAKANQPVLVLIFGHGEFETSDILLGCRAEEQGSKLTQDMLASALQKKVQTTVILTSCYSGGWIMKPNINEHFDVEPAFNHSFLTAADREEPSNSWAVSQSVGRQAGGSVFATCLINSIITLNDRREAADDDEKSDTIAALAQQIQDECKARCGSIWDQHKFSFAAQDDRWEQAWNKRTGLPLLNYKQIWESLPEAPPMLEVYPPGAPLAGSFMSRSPKALCNMVRVKAVRYMNSKPGPDNIGPNTNCHPRFKRLVEGKDLDLDELHRCDNILDYRQAQMIKAEEYCGPLGIGLPKDQRADKIDPWEWERSRFIEKNEGPPESSKSAIDLLKKFNTAISWIHNLQIFDIALPEQGLGYPKAWYYLAFRIAESPIPTEQIKKKLEDVVQYKERQAASVARSPLGEAVLNQPAVQEKIKKRTRFMNTMRRSLSPKKRARAGEVSERQED